MGALLGIGFVRATHALTGTGELDLDGADADPTHGHKALLADTLNVAHEGIAIGAATALSLPLGVALALTLAVHNVPEALVLGRAPAGQWWGGAVHPGHPARAGRPGRRGPGLRGGP